MFDREKQNEILGRMKLAAFFLAMLVLGALVLCTASLVDASYNPFLYFRF